MEQAKARKRNSASSKLLLQLRGALRNVADPTRAVAMQAYMKSTMPYHGVAATPTRAVCREVFASYPFEDAESWRADVLDLWRNAKFREERYGAIALASHRNAKRFQNLDALPMYEEMIVTGAWWDYVDDFAAHRVGALLEAYPRAMKRTMLAWSRSPDMWKRRTSIICQLGVGDATDQKLLFDCIEPSLPSKEFFLRKAIGWALRQLAKYDLPAVIRYVKEHQTELSPLSQREALKHFPEKIPGKMVTQTPKKPQKSRQRPSTK